MKVTRTADCVMPLTLNRMKKTAAYLREKKQRQERISALTCYDYPTALLEDKAGIDLIIVGDSVGTNILGYDDETQVTMDDIVHHLKAVKRGATSCYILADLPYATYETPEQALGNAQRLLDNGADGVKLEGQREAVVAYLVERGVPVSGHLGLLPQIHTQHTVQGKTFQQAQAILEGALALEKLGICMLVLELVPEELAQTISQRLTIPTIGIGAGRFTDGQVLVINDILGLTPFKLRLAKRYQDYQTLTLQAIQQYRQEVEQRQFPSEANARHMPEEELEKLNQWLSLT